MTLFLGKRQYFAGGLETPERSLRAGAAEFVSPEEVTSSADCAGRQPIYCDVATVKRHI